MKNFFLTARGWFANFCNEVYLIWLGGKIAWLEIILTRKVGTSEYHEMYLLVIPNQEKYQRILRRIQAYRDCRKRQ